ncbi:MAG: 4'-phosphopantetheinyl transferase superfamily protein, partial [Myxococcota bacterium]|nr:4'-phosphopantetheinyl transferase superfamily protein [Myxococcota bacterium]
VELGEAVVPQPLPPASYFPEEGLSKEAIYQRFFHGPAFQVLHEAWAIGAMGINADAQVFHGAIAAGLVTAPLILEAAFQAAGLHRMATDGVMALPESIGQVRMLGTVEDGAQLQISVQNNAEGYDIDVHSGQVGVMMVRGFRMAELGPLPEGDLIPVPDGGWPEAVIALAATGQGTHTVTPGELAEIRSRGSARRVSDRLVGRVAAKRAVSVLTGLGHREFVIRNDGRGRPLVRRSDGGSAPVVSLSHRAGRAVAVASWEGAVGIDLEQVEERHPSFARTWFREAEQRLCGGDPRRETATWAIKEAVLKALGRGLALDPRDVEVLTLDSFMADIVLHGQARDLHRNTELGPFEVHLQHEADAVMVFARAEVLDRVA